MYSVSNNISGIIMIIMIISFRVKTNTDFPDLTDNIKISVISAFSAGNNKSVRSVRNYLV